MSARRYNKGKLRMELIPPRAIKELSKVFTIGAEKYTLYDDNGNVVDDGADNWRKGLSWSSVIGAVKRHIAKFEAGEDFDSDYPQELLDVYGPTYHLSNAMWGLSVLMEYYKIHPELDDRKHWYLNDRKIGLDIDEVLADFASHWCKYHNIENTPEWWNFDTKMKDRFKDVINDKDFWLSIPTITDPKSIGFEPHCYITSRSIPKEWTEEWIAKNGFPTVPVYCVPHNESKVHIAKQLGITHFVDDRFENFVELNKAGIACYLFDAPHNKRYDVGYKRLFNLNKLG
jgi:hypothetical protein